MPAFEFFLPPMELDFSSFSARMFPAFLMDHILVSSAKHFEVRSFNQHAYPYDQNSNNMHTPMIKIAIIRKALNTLGKKSCALILTVPDALSMCGLRIFAGALIHLKSPAAFAASGCITAMCQQAVSSMSWFHAFNSISWQSEHATLSFWRYG